MQEVSWQYRVGGGTGVFELPSDPNCVSTTGNQCPHYINNINNGVYVSANQNVKQIDFRVDSFESEACCDSLALSRAGLAQTKLQGTPTTGWYSTPNDGTSLERKPALLSFVTDFSITNRGFNIGRARVCCGVADTSDPVFLTQITRHSGVLLGNNDTVYYKIANLGAGQHQWVALKGPAGADFDLYARCGSLPTPTQYNFRGFSVNAQEFIDIPPTCPLLYIAVNSFRGAGQFDIYMDFHAANSHHTMSAGFDFVPSAAQITQITATLQGAARRFFGATEGQQIIDRVDVYTNGSCSNCNGRACEICFKNSGGTGLSPVCSAGTISIFQGYFGSPGGVAHELGHRWFCAGDEYVNGSQWQCGHSIMANPFGDQHNMCIDRNHKRDGNPLATATSLPPAWTQAANGGAVVTTPTTTPDNYDYSDFDFNELVGTIVTH